MVLYNVLYHVATVGESSFSFLPSASLYHVLRVLRTLQYHPLAISEEANPHARAAFSTGHILPCKRGASFDYLFSFIFFLIPIFMGFHL